jgi:maltose O-acetyltransferase
MKFLRYSIFRIVDWFLQLHTYYAYTILRDKYTVDPTFVFNGSNIKFYGSGSIVIGSNSYIGENSSIQAYSNCTVNIGQGCMISHNVKFYTQSQESDFDFSLASVPLKTGDIKVGDFVWIGANVFISPGVSIGANAVIGANSVVTKDVEPFAIYGGVPAKLIRYKKIVKDGF